MSVKEWFLKTFQGPCGAKVVSCKQIAWSILDEYEFEQLSSGCWAAGIVI